jgi:hypothetical protein
VLVPTKLVGRVLKVNTARVVIVASLPCEKRAGMNRGPAWSREDSACEGVDSGYTNLLCGSKGERDGGEKKEFHFEFLGF